MLRRIYRLAQDLALIVAILIFVDVGSWLIASGVCDNADSTIGSPSLHQNQRTFSGGIVVNGIASIGRLRPDDWTAIATAVIAIFTWRLWWSTKVLAEIADRQGDDDRISQRANITVEPGGTNPYSQSRRFHDERISSDVLIINAGRFPAQRIRWSIKVGYSDNPDYRTPRVTDSDLINGPGIALAAGRQARKGVEKPTVREEFDRWRIGAKPDRAWLFVWGRIRYYDGFSDARCTDFCHRYNLHGATGYTIPAENGRYHEYGNHIDES
jgi:hypothetical protein